MFCGFEIHISYLTSILFNITPLAHIYTFLSVIFDALIIKFVTFDYRHILYRIRPVSKLSSCSSSIFHFFEQPSKVCSVIMKIMYVLYILHNRL